MQKERKVTIWAMSTKWFLPKVTLSAQKKMGGRPFIYKNRISGRWQQIVANSIGLLILRKVKT
jgi:hypothetical protein